MPRSVILRSGILPLCSCSPLPVRTALGLLASARQSWLDTPKANRLGVSKRATPEAYPSRFPS